MSIRVVDSARLADELPALHALEDAGGFRRRRWSSIRPHGGTPGRLRSRGAYRPRPDVRGLQHLAVLLANPETEVSALALEQRSLPAGSTAAARERTVPHDARERARVNVTRALAAAMKRIAANHPELGRHLARTVRTGTFCVYRPDPRVPIAWRS